MKNDKLKKLRVLFFTTLYISAFTFGGGFVIITLMKKNFVDKLKWIGDNEMLDYIALAQSSPGALAVNAAILTGWHIGGLAGMAVAVIGTIIPPIVILSLVYIFYSVFKENRFVSLFFKGMQAGVAAVIFDVVFSLSGNILKEKSIVLVIVAVSAFCAVFFFDISAIAVIGAILFIGIIAAVIDMKRRKKNDLS